MTKPEIKSILAELGFATPEIEVYLAGLEFGAQPASLLAKKSGLKRGHTYNVLNELIKKGVMQEFIKNKVHHYTSSSPATLMSILDHNQQEIERRKQKLLGVLPMLEKIQNPFIVQPKVRFFHGIEGLKEIYEDTIRIPGETIYAIADFDYIFPAGENRELYDWIWNYAKRRSKNNNPYLGIANKSSFSDQAYRRCVKEKRKLKMLNGVYLPVEVNIYGNKVAVMSTYKDMAGIIIEDAPIAETLRNFHKAIWEFLPDYRLR